jgi:hypothetical protein
MAAENRTIVTNNVVDFVLIFRRALAEVSGQPLLTSDLPPRSTAETGRFVSVPRPRQRSKVPRAR